MTVVDFYSNVPDKQSLINDLIAGALKKQRLVTLFAEDIMVAEQMSAHIWQASNTSFLPNLLANHALVQHVSIQIAWQAGQVLQDDFLINCQSEQLTFFSRFKQLAEIVGLEDADKQSARARYKFYRDRGYEIKHTDFAKNSL
jgi:DNA polymerase III subunit chi